MSDGHVWIVSYCLGTFIINKVQKAITVLLTSSSRICLSPYDPCIINIYKLFSMRTYKTAYRDQKKLQNLNSIYRKENAAAKHKLVYTGQDLVASIVLLLLLRIQRETHHYMLCR